MWSESEMPVKDFILLVVYLLVCQSCNFAKTNQICQRIPLVTLVTIVEWRSALKREGKKNFESKYHDVKKKSLKWKSTLVSLFTYNEEEKT